MDIYTKIERYSDLEVGLELARKAKAELVDGVLTPEIRERLAEIDAEFDPKIDALMQERAGLEAAIKAEVLRAGKTIKGTYHSFVWNKGRVSWDTKALDGYAKAHPEIEAFRSEGNPSVSVRRA